MRNEKGEDSAWISQGVTTQFFSITFLVWAFLQRFLGGLLTFIAKLWNLLLQNRAKEEIFIIFGSQTGTAEEYANQLSNNLTSLGIKHSLIDAFDLELSSFHKKQRAIFIVSTHGVGEPPDNIAHVYKYFKDCVARGKRMKNVSYTIFGLGDSAYVDYNEAAKSLHDLLRSLGAREFFPRALGDTAYKLDAAFNCWMGNLTRTHFLPPGKQMTTLERSKQLEDGLLQREAFHIQNSSTPPNRHAVHFLSVASSENIAPGSSKNVKLIRFVSSALKVSYEPGDHFGCFPPNTTNVIDAVIRQLHISEDEQSRYVTDYVEIQGTPIAPSCSVLQFLKWHADLHGAPKQQMLQQLANYLPNESQKNALFNVLKGPSTPKFLSIIDILREHKVNRQCISLGAFLNMLPLQVPRLYSICNYSFVDPEVSIAVSALEGGLCSQWLCSLQSEDSVPMFISRSSFHLQFSEMNKKIIFVSTGTGIAPFVGFLQKRHFWLNGRVKANTKMNKIKQKCDKQNTDSDGLGSLTLFFGCRRATDCLFGTLIRKVQCCTSATPDFKSLYLRNKKVENPVNIPVEGKTDSIVLNHMYLAFSREPPNCYVQNRIDTHSDLVWDAIREDGIIYICGDALQMCADVEKCLVEVIERHSGHTGDSALAYFDELKSKGRLRRDVWDG